MTEPISPPNHGCFISLPPQGSNERQHLESKGEEAIASGKVACIILAGGMATRFGNVVKATVPVLGEKTFLDIKLQGVARYGQRISVWIMTSFATHDAIESHLLKREWKERLDIKCFPQFLSLRLNPDASVFYDETGSPSPYATGHGDLPAALKKSGLLESFIKKGGKVLFVSNVDNVGATLEPAIIGWHLEHGAPLSIEVAPKKPGDKGGAPAVVSGRTVIVEGFRFPPSFDQDSIQVFNTNTFTISADSIKEEIPLPYHPVEKTVKNQKVLQFERLLGELSFFIETRFLLVEREGEGSRFLPVKDVDELNQRRMAIIKIAEELEKKYL
ncbi:MAG: UTP--glucose-1-phosphate uridylyltransferase [Sandaracinaceae bacterium]|nr:UTP--glucose-1-phosphate uridylyltransferase [Sandaracinaceae bacterium]